MERPALERLLHSLNVPVSQKGWLCLWQESATKNGSGANTVQIRKGEWVARYCRVKSNLLFLNTEKPVKSEWSAVLLECVEQNAAPLHLTHQAWATKFDSPSLENDKKGEANDILKSKDSTAIRIFPLPPPTNMANGVTYLLAGSSESAENWLRTFSNASLQEKLNGIVIRQVNGRGPWSRDESKSKGNDKQVVEAQVKIAKLNSQLEEARNEIIRLNGEKKEIEVANNRLQRAAEINEKSTDELVQHRIWENRSLAQQLSYSNEEVDSLQKKVMALSKKENELKQQNANLHSEVSELKDTIRGIVADLENSKDAPEESTLKLHKLQTENQRLVVENRKQKVELRDSSKRFTKMEEDNARRLQVLKDILEISDVFDLLRKQRDLLIFRIKYLEDAYEMPKEDAEELRTTILMMQHEVALADCAARSQYLKLRSHVLEEQLAIATSEAKRAAGMPVSKWTCDYYLFAKTIIDRYGWAFREAFVSDGVEKEAGNKDRDVVWWSENLKSRQFMPFGDQQFYSTGVEGGMPPKFSVLGSPFDIKKIPEKRIPASQYFKVVEELNNAEQRAKIYSDLWKKAQNEA